jgi:ABC-type Fe3+ transport system substrate-binding protein
VKFYGEEKARDYMKKFSAQKAAFRDSETVVTSELTEGGKL